MQQSLKKSFFWLCLWLLLTQFEPLSAKNSIPLGLGHRPANPSLESITNAVFSADERAIIISCYSKHIYTIDLENGKINTGQTRLLFPGIAKTQDQRFTITVPSLNNYLKPVPKKVVVPCMVIKNMATKNEITLYLFENGGWVLLGDTAIATENVSKVELDRLSSVLFNDIALIHKKPIENYLLKNFIASNGLAKNIISMTKLNNNTVINLKPKPKIKIAPILQGSLTSTLELTVIHGAKKGYTVLVFLNGYPLHELKENNIADSLIFTIPLAPYFKNGLLQYGETNMVEVKVFNPPKKANAELFDFLDQLHGMAEPKQLLNAALMQFTLQQNPIPRLIIPKGHQSGITVLTGSPTGDFFISGDMNGNVIIWDMISGQELRSLKLGLGAVFQASLSADGKYLLTGSQQENNWPFQYQYKLFSLDSDSEVYILEDEERLKLAFDADGKSLLDFSKNQQITLTDLSIHPFLPEKKGIYLYEKSPFAKQYLLNTADEANTYQFKLQLWNTESNNSLVEYETSSRYRQASFFNNGTCFYTFNDDELVFWKTTESKPWKVFKPEYNGKIKQVFMSVKKQEITMVELSGNVKSIRMDDAKLTMLTNKLPDRTAMLLMADQEKALLGDHNGKIELLHLSDHSVTQTYRGKAISIDDFGWHQVSKLMFMKEKDATEVKLLSFRPERPIWNLIHEKQVGTVSFSPNGNYILTCEREGKAFLWNAQSGKKIYDVAGTNNKCEDAGFMDDGTLYFIVKDSNGGLQTLKKDTLGHSINSKAVNFYRNDFNYDSPYIFKKELDRSLNNNQVIKIFNRNSQALLATLTAFEANEWLISSPDGYFMCTKNISKSLRYEIGGKLYDFDQFDLFFNRPDLILKRLDIFPFQHLEVYQQLYKKRLGKMMFTEKNFGGNLIWNAPTVKLLNADDYKEGATAKNIVLNVQCSDTKYPIKRINIYLNGIRLSGINELTIANQKELTLNRNIPITLSNGKNNIEITAENEIGIESYAENIILINQNKARAKLYLIGIGADQYAYSAIQNKNLKYPAKDVSDLAVLFKAQHNLYDEVDTILLKHKEVTLANILKLKSILQQTEINDRVIIFYAGHGVRDQDKNLFLGTYNMDFTKPSQNGLTFDMLENLLDDIPARSKILVVDACYAGTTDKDDLTMAEHAGKNKTIKSLANPYLSIGNQLDEIFVDISKHTGTTILASTKASEKAIEGDFWNNSAFVYCLLKGLETKTADFDKDGIIKLSELQQYLNIEVSKVTYESQRPNFRIENYKGDFAIW